METPTKDLELKNLGQFTGTEQYWKDWLDTLTTDGVHYLTENGYAWLVSDAISAIKTEPRLMREEFLAIKFTVDDLHHGAMAIGDGNNNVLYSQKYDYTDAKANVTMYFENEVLLLPSER